MKAISKATIERVVAFYMHKTNKRSQMGPLSYKIQSFHPTPLKVGDITSLYLHLILIITALIRFFLPYEVWEVF